MNGKGSVRFSDLFADTVSVHGIAWAWRHYVCKHGMADWEFAFWCRATKTEWK